MIYLVAIICVVVGFIGGIFASSVVRTDLERVHESLLNEINLIHARLTSIDRAVSGDKAQAVQNPLPASSTKPNA